MIAKINLHILTFSNVHMNGGNRRKSINLYRNFLAVIKTNK